MTPVRRASKRNGKAQQPVERSVRIREMDPWLMCGPDTSVERLYRLEERLGSVRHYHLVFFDRRGWYCEHGRSCPAVVDVRRFIRQR